MSSRATRAKAARAIALRVRNVHRVAGRPVTQEEVLRYARPGHNACKARTGKPAGIVFDPRKGTYHYCRCATEGLIAEHPEVILNADGSAFWPRDEDDDEGPGPYQTVADNGQTVQRLTRDPLPGETDTQGDGHGEQAEGTEGEDGAGRDPT